MAYVANPTWLVKTGNASAPLLVKSMMDLNVPLAHLVRITIGSPRNVMPLAQRLELPTKSLEEEKVSVVDQDIPLVKQSAAHPVPMKLELLGNAVNPDLPSTPTETVSNHPTSHEPSSETVLPRFNWNYHLHISD
jgi:hypothetical protein